MRHNFSPDGLSTDHGRPPDRADRPCWPSVEGMLASRGASGATAWVKTWWRMQRSRAHQESLLDVLAKHPVWAQRFDQHPGYFHCAISHYVDRRFSSAQRVSALAQDLVIADRCFGPELSARVSSGERVLLWSLQEGVHLCLGLNDVSVHEGLWALSLRDDTGRRLYLLSFSFRSPEAMLVATLQGPAASEESGLCLVRRLTKQAQGLRPQALMMAALRAVCGAWQIGAIAGIAPQHHIKGRWNLRCKRLRFDYVGFWQEQGGCEASDGHWSLPLMLAPRPPQDIAPQKRAMYKRRQHMIDCMNSQIAKSLNGSSH